MTELVFDPDSDLNFGSVDLSLRILEKRVEPTAENRMREIRDHEEVTCDRIVYETVYALHKKWAEKIGATLSRPYIENWT